MREYKTVMTRRWTSGIASSPSVKCFERNRSDFMPVKAEGVNKTAMNCSCMYSTQRRSNDKYLIFSRHEPTPYVAIVQLSCCPAKETGKGGQYFLCWPAPFCIHTILFSAHPLFEQFMPPLRSTAKFWLCWKRLIHNCRSSSLINYKFAVPLSPFH